MRSQQQVCQNGAINKEEIMGKGYRAELGIDDTNQRLKVLSFTGINIFDLAERVQEYAFEKNLGKVLVNAKKNSCADFKRAGYVLEGTIPGYFMGEDAFCYSFFTDQSRANSIHLDEENKILQDVFAVKKESSPRKASPVGLQLRDVTKDDVAHIVNLYKRSFASYPSPLFNPDYILKVMQEQVYFLAVFNEKGVPLSAGSADIDYKNRNAEITDLATDKSAQGLGLATTIILALEKEMWQQRQLKCLYSLSRAGIVGVNRAFYKLGYTYHGRLLNNCHIGGRFEDMNIWVKIRPI